jgi:hypothetical protein
MRVFVVVCCRRSDFFFFSSAFASAENARADPNNGSEREKESLLLLTFQTRIDTFFALLFICIKPVIRSSFLLSAVMISPFWLRCGMGILIKEIDFVLSILSPDLRHINKQMTDVCQFSNHKVVIKSAALKYCKVGKKKSQFC